MTPLVSVLINNYNYARFLPDAIESALGQSYGNLEVVVVDDGSSDDSRAIIAAFAERDARVRGIFKENGGQASAFNAGFAAARGELVAFLDADDYFYPEKIETIVGSYKADPRHVMFYHPVQRVDAQGKRLGKPIPPHGITGSLEGILRASGGWYPFPPTSGLVFNRGIMERVFPVPCDKLKLCADSYLHDTACFLGSVCHVPQPLAAYRIHGGNLFSTPQYVSQNAQSQRIARNTVRNCTLNVFLLENGREPVDLERCVSINIEKWILAGMPAHLLPGLMYAALTYPALRPLERLRYCARLPKNYLKGLLGKLLPGSP